MSKTSSLKSLELSDSCIYLYRNLNTMEVGLDDILKRINMKLNCFTSEATSHSQANRISYFNTSQTHQSYGKQTQMQHIPQKFPPTSASLPNIFTANSQAMCQQSQYLNFAQPSRNNTCNYSDLQRFKSQKHVESSKNCLKANNSQANIHEENYLSLLKRNKALENDVQQLQNRLRVFEEGLNKVSDKSRWPTQKASHPLKIKKKLNYSRDPNNFTSFQASPEAFSIGKSSFCQKTTKKKTQFCSKINKEKISTNKPQFNRVCIRNTNDGLQSLKFDKGNRKADGVEKGDEYKKPAYHSETVLRCKSSQIPNQQKEGKHKTKAGKKNISNSKIEYNRAYLFSSHSSYLGPLEKYNFEGGQSKLVKKAAGRGPKFHQISLGRSEKYK